MKKIITTAILTVIASLSFAIEPTFTNASQNDVALETKQPLLKTTAPKNWFAYVRATATDSYPADSVQIIPGGGIGYRFNVGSHGFDVSANYNVGTGWRGEHKSSFWTLPKASYLFYLSPTKNESFYAGAGLSWGKIETKDQRSFTGIMPNFTLGMEMLRTQVLKTFVELNVTQPAIAYQVSDRFPGPVAEISIGGGF